MSALGEARDITELGEIFAIRIEPLGYHSAGYLRIYGEGRFHTAEYLFGGSVAGWSERYQTKRYSINDPVFITSCRSTGAFTLEEVAGPSRDGALILADSRSHGLFDGLVAPFRASYDEVGFVLLGTENQVNLHDYERFLLQGMCETYARSGMALLPVRADSTGTDPAGERMLSGSPRAAVIHRSVCSLACRQTRFTRMLRLRKRNWMPTRAHSSFCAR